MFRYTMLAAAAVCLLFTAAARADLAILPLGDSITYGTRAKAQAGYRMELGSLLDDSGLTYEFVGTLGALDVGEPDLPHNAYPGKHAAQVLSALQNDDVFETLTDAGKQPNLVLLHIGTNGLSGSTSSAESARDRLGPLLQYLDEQRGIGLAADTTVLLARIIPHTRGNGKDGLGSFGLDQMNVTAYYNDLAAALVASKFSHFVQLVDMFNIPMANLDLTRLGVEASVLDLDGDGFVDWIRNSDGPRERDLFRDDWYLNTAMMTELNGNEYDGTHPTALGYNVMAQQWLAAIPEPTTAALLAGGAVLALTRRRR